MKADDLTNREIDVLASLSRWKDHRGITPMHLGGRDQSHHGRTSSDDGISQEVAVKAGVTLRGTETLKNRVSLAPFRTFREVTQPLSEFVFRVRQRTDEVPQLALFEADGGKWKIDALENVARYLSAAISDIPVVS